MKAVLLPLTLAGVVALSSCVNPALTSSPNRYGYNGTVTGGGAAMVPPVNPGPTVAVNQTTPPPASVANDPTPIDLDSTPAPERTPVTPPPAPAPDPTPAPPSNVADNDPPAAPEPEPKLEIPYAIPVPGKEGLVYSPHNKDAGHADVRGMRPGVIVEDPYAPGKYFRVP